MNNDRIARLAQTGDDLFSVRDLALIWRVENKNTLYVALSRYVDRGILKRVHKGLYSLRDINGLDPVLLGHKALNNYNYLSTESVLFRKGIIMQKPIYHTFVSSISKKFGINGEMFKSRQLRDRYLFNDHGIESKNGVPQASVARAVADLLYFNPNYYFDNKKAIDWRAVNLIKKKIYDPSQ